MQSAPLELAGVEPPCAYRAPILCAELPQSGAQLASVLDGPTSTGTWRYHVLVDFPYLVLYAALLAGSFWLARGGRVPAALVTLGAGADVVENLALLRALDGDRADSVAALARGAAHTKFFLLAVGIAAGMAMLARATERPALRGIYGLVAVCAAVGLAGPASPVALEVGLLGIVLACLTLSVRAFVDARG